HDGAYERSPGRAHRDAGRRGGTGRRPALGDRRAQRPGQPDELRQLGIPETVRVQRGQGAQADARRAPQGAGDRLVRYPGEDGARRVAPARLWPVGHGEPRLSTFRRHRDQCVARFAADEVAVLRQVASEVIGLLTENFDRDDPVVERLFPDVYADDPAEAAEFRRYTEGDLK